MFKLATIDTVDDAPMWTRYRSLKLGRPVLHEQAYGATFEWIEFDGIYFHRSLEFGLQCFINNVIPPEFLQKEYNTVIAILNKFKEGSVSISDLAIKAPIDNTERRLHYLKMYESICIIGMPSFSISGWKCKIYTDCYSLGGDFIFDIEDCIKLSNIMPVICKKSIVDAKLFSTVNWSNVWLFDK